MILDISPIGWFLIALFYAAAAVGLTALWRRWRSVVGRAIVTLVVPIAIALPIADELRIGWNFKQACKNAGVRVIRPVEVEGYLNATSATLPVDDSDAGPVGKPGQVFSFEKEGYRFQENLGKNGRVSHWERKGDQMIVTVRDRPEARYEYRFADPRQEVPIGLKLQKIEKLIVDLSTGEILGRELCYNRYPGWVEGLWIGLVGSGLTICPDFEKDPPQPPFPRAVLIPKGKR